MVRFRRWKQSQSGLFIKFNNNILYKFSACQRIFQTFVSEPCPCRSRYYLRRFLIMHKTCYIIIVNHIPDAYEQTAYIPSSVFNHPDFEMLTAKSCKYFFNFFLFFFWIRCNIDICILRHRHGIFQRFFQQILKIQMHNQRHPIPSGRLFIFSFIGIFLWKNRIQIQILNNIRLIIIP